MTYPKRIIKQFTLPSSYPHHQHSSEEARDIAYNGLILLTQVGSGTHGTSVSGQDDRDEMGICLEPSRYVTGLSRVPAGERKTIPFEQYERHTAWDREGGVKNRAGAGDLDTIVYSARKWCRLAMDGNPTVLLPLFVPDSDVMYRTSDGCELVANSHRFISQRVADRFLGYLHAQRGGMTGIGHTNRPELVALHGYDCYLNDTEFLTRRGWLLYDDIEDEEEVATISATGTIEFQKPSERISKPYSGPIHYGKSRYSSWAVTPNHRMWVSKVERGAWGRLGNGYSEDRANWQFLRADQITDRSWHTRVTGEPSVNEYPIDDADLALVGAFVSEGCVGKRLKDGTPSVLRFEQKDEGRLFPIMETVGSKYKLRSYYYPEKRPVTIWTLADRQMATKIAEECGEGSHKKRLPQWASSLSGRQAELLLQALLAGDGTKYHSGGWVYYTVSPGLSGDVQALATIAGRRSLVWGPYKPCDMYQVFLADPEPIRQFEAFIPRLHLTIEEVTDARIVCFTVPNERLVTRREGRVAMHGNTKFAMHALRLGYQGIEILTTGKLTLPISEPTLTYLRAVRKGEYPLSEIMGTIEELENELRKLKESNDLPQDPDIEWVNDWLHDAYMDYWKEGWVQL